MFDTILKRILLTNLNKYIEGIDEKNFKLGLWSGAISIANVSFKNEFIETLGLPLKMIFSHVGKLSLQIPWKSLGSKPVEAVLEDVFLIIQPIEERAWAVSDYDLLLKRLELLEQYLERYTKIDSQEDKKKQALDLQKSDRSLVMRIASKILDNLQISIRNVHIRFEGIFKDLRYVCGITLDEISVFTTNAEWKKEFVERGRKKAKTIPLRKLLSLKNLAVYWTPEASAFYGTRSKEEIKQLMTEQILRDRNKHKDKNEYLGSISATCRLTMRSGIFGKSEQNEEPDLEGQITLSSLDLKFTKVQLGELGQMLGLIIARWRHKANTLNKRKQEANALLESDRKMHMDEFKSMYKKLLAGENKHEWKEKEENLKAILKSDENTNKFKSLALGLSVHEISKAVREIAEELGEEEKEQEKEESPEKSKNQEEKVKNLEEGNKKWFKKWFSWKKKENKAANSLFGVIGAEDLEKYLVEAETREGSQYDEDLETRDRDDLSDRTSESTLFSQRDLDPTPESVVLTIESPGGSICLSDKGSFEAGEGAKFSLKDLNMRISFGSERFYFQLSLKDCEGWLKTHAGIQGRKYLEVPLIRRANYWQASKQSDNVISLEYESEIQNVDSESSTRLEFSNIQIAWRPQVIDWTERFVNVFKTTSITSAIKELEMLQKIKSESEDTLESQLDLGPRKNALNITLNSSVVIMPCSQEGTIEDECWALSVGKMYTDIIFGRNFSLKEALSTKDKRIYENENIKFKQVKLEYWPSQVLCERISQSESQTGNLAALKPEEKERVKNMFKILEEAGFEINIGRTINVRNDRMMRPQDEDNESINVNIDIDKISINLTPEILMKFWSLEEVFSFESLGEKTKEEIIQGCSKSGFLHVKKRGAALDQWTRRFCIVKGNRLYCFREMSSLIAKAKLRLNLTENSLKESDETSKPFTFIVKDRSREICFAAESESELNDWLGVIKANAVGTDEPEQQEMNLETAIKTEQDFYISPILPRQSVYPKDDTFQSSKTLSVNLKGLKVSFFENTKEKLFEFDGEGFSLTMEKLPLLIKMEVRIKEFEINEYLSEKADPNIPTVIVSSRPPSLTSSIPFCYRDKKIKNIPIEGHIGLQVIKLDKLHSEYKDSQSGLKITCVSQYMEINFKPDFIQRAVQMLESLTSSSKPEERDSHKPEAPDFQKVVVDIKIELEEVVLRMIQIMSPVCLAELRAHNAQLSICRKSYSTDIEGFIEDFGLYDTTNYPYTSFLYPAGMFTGTDRVKPFAILKPAGTSKSPLEFKFRGYDDEHPDVDYQRRVFSFLELKLENPQLEYMQQVIDRVIINYFAEQFLPAILGELKVKGMYKEDPVTLDILMKKIEQPKFLDLNVQLINPIIRVRPYPEAREYLEMRLDKLNVTNEMERDKSRIGQAYQSYLDSVWCAKYNIELLEGELFAVDGRSQPKELWFGKMSFFLIVELPLFTKVYENIVGKKSPANSPSKGRREDTKIIDNTGRVEGFFGSPAYLTMTHEDYLIFMKCMDRNLGYKDQMDYLFSLENVITAGPSPTEIKIKFDSLTLLMLEKMNAPFAKLTFKPLIFDIQIGTNKKMQITSKGSQCNLVYFKPKKEQPHIYKEKQLFGCFTAPPHLYSLEITPNNRYFLKEILMFQETTSPIEAEAKSEELKDRIKSATLDLSIRDGMNGNKIVYLGFSDLRGYFVFPMLGKLADFFSTEEEISVAPFMRENSSVSFVTAFQEDDYILEDRLDWSPTKQPGVDEEGIKREELSVKLEAKNTLLMLPKKRMKKSLLQNTIVVSGDLIVESVKFINPDIKEALLKSRTHQFNKLLDQASDENISRRLTVSLYGVEGFLINARHFLDVQDLNLIDKRHIISIYCLGLKKDTHMVLNRIKTRLIPVSKTEIITDSFKTALSLDDLSQLEGIVEYQKKNPAQPTSPDKFSSPPVTANNKVLRSPGEICKDDEEHKKIEKFKTSNYDDQDVQFKRNVSYMTPDDFNDPEKPTSNQISEIYVNLQNIQIALLMNRKDGSLAPALQFRIFESFGNLVDEEDLFILKGKVVFDCTYYNPLLLRWEPIVEKFGADFEFSKQITSKMRIKLFNQDDSNALNVNLSEQAIPVISMLVQNWEKRIQTNPPALPEIPDHELFSPTIKEKENIALKVSPCTICNRTGYPIEIEGYQLEKNDKIRDHAFFSKKVYRVETGESLNYYLDSNLHILLNQSESPIAPRCRLKVAIVHPVEKLSIPDPIDVYSKPMTCHCVTSEEIGQSFKFICDIKHDNGQIFVSFSSCLEIHNCLPSPYSLIFESEGRYLDLVINEQSSMTIPIDFLEDSIIIFRSKDLQSETSEPTSLRNLLPTPDQSTRSSGILIGSSFCLVECTKVDEVYKMTMKSYFSIKNYCAAELDYRLFYENKKTTSQRTVNPNGTIYEARAEPDIKSVVIRVKLKSLAWSQKEVIDCKKSKEKEIVLKDLQGNQLSLYTYVLKKGNGVQEILLYTKGFIVNETLQSLQYFDIYKKKWTKLTGQQVIEGDEAKNPHVLLTNQMISLGIQNEKECSSVLNTNIAGDCYLQLRSNNGVGEIEICSNVKEVVLHEKPKIVVKAITLSPRYIISNNTFNDIEIKVNEFENESFVVQKGKRAPVGYINWKNINDKSTRNVSIRPIEENPLNPKWKWSGNLNMTALGVENFIVQNPVCVDQFKYYKATITSYNTTLFLSIDEYEPDNVPYKVENNCQDLDILLYQKGTHPASGILVRTGERIPWSWTYPLKKKEIVGDFQTLDNITYHFSNFVVTFDHLNEQATTIVPMGDQKMQKVSVQMIVERNAFILNFKTVDIMDEQLNEEEEKKKDINRKKAEFESRLQPLIIDMDIQVMVEKMSISLITNEINQKDGQRQRKEILVGLLKGFKFNMVEYGQRRYSHLKIKDMNLVNNELQTLFPIVFTSSRPQRLADDAHQNLLNILVVEKMNLKIPYYESIHFSVAESTLNLELPFLKSVKATFERLGNGMNENPNLSNKNVSSEDHNPQGLEEYNDSFFWKTLIAPEKPGKLFIQELVVYPASLKLSFRSKRGDFVNNNNSFSGTIINVLATAFANVNNAPLYLSGYKFSNLFGSSNDILLNMFNTYKVDLIKAGICMIGSLSILGSPVDIGDSLVTNVFDTFEETLEGLRRGPLEGTQAFAKSTGLTVKNVAANVFNSVSHITFSLASGLSNLTLDDEYLEQRDTDMSKRAKSVGQGLLQGLKLIIQGLGQGVQGIFILPIKGASKGGLKGFFFGVYQGVAGVTVKPIVGMLDAVSKTTEGINRSLTKSDDKALDERPRLPRIFYGKEGFYKENAQEDGEAFVILYGTDRKRSTQTGFVEAFEIIVEEDKDIKKTLILVLTFDVVLCWDMAKERVIWSLSLDNIKTAEITSIGLEIRLINPTKEIKDNIIRILNNNTEQNELILRQIKELQEVSAQEAWIKA